MFTLSDSYIRKILLLQYTAIYIPTFYNIQQFIYPKQHCLKGCTRRNVQTVESLHTLVTGNEIC